MRKGRRRRRLAECLRKVVPKDGPACLCTAWSGHGRGCGVVVLWCVVTVCGGVMVLWCLLCGEVLCSGGAVVCGDGVGFVVVVWVVWWCCVEGGVVWWWCCGCDVVALCGGVMCVWWPCDVVWVVWKWLWCGGAVVCGDSMWWCNGAVVVCCCGVCGYDVVWVVWKGVWCGGVVVMVCFVLWCCSGAVVFLWWCCVVRDGVVLCHCGEGGVVRVVFCGGVDVCVVVLL